MHEKGLLTRTYAARDQVPDCPDFTRAKNKLPSWDKYLMPRHHNYTTTTTIRKQKWEEKQLYGYFKGQTDEISCVKTRICQTRGKFERETESLQIATQNNSIMTGYVKTKIDRTQQKSKCRLCGDKDEAIIHKISECSKLAQKRVENLTQLVREGDPLGIVQEV